MRKSFQAAGIAQGKGPKAGEYGQARWPVRVGQSKKPVCVGDMANLSQTEVYVISLRSRFIPRH